MRADRRRERTNTTVHRTSFIYTYANMLKFIKVFDTNANIHLVTTSNKCSEFVHCPTDFNCYYRRGINSGVSGLYSEV